MRSRAQAGGRPASIAATRALAIRTCPCGRDAGRQPGDRRRRAVSGGLKGIGRTHTLIKLRSPDGKAAVVDLGADVPSALALEKGSLLSVQGLPARINDRPVVVARRVIRVPRESQDQGRR